MIEVEISNFQSIRHVQVTIDKFAAIVGRSNIGKSAIVRALQHALTGAVGTDFVRHSSTCDRIVRETKKCKCFSSVRYKSSAIEVTWEKGDSINRYTVRKDGAEEVYNGLDRGTPDFLKDAFVPVEVGETRGLIQIPDQFDPVFLLNKPGTVVADVLSDVAQLDEINVAMAMAVKDRKEAIATRKVRSADVDTLTEDLKAYHGLDRLVSAVPTLQTTLKQVTRSQEALLRVDRFIASANSLRDGVLGLKQATAAELPDLPRLEVEAQRLLQVVRFSRESLDLCEALRVLEDAMAPALPASEPLERAGRRYSDLSRFVTSLEERAPVIRNLAGVDKVMVPEIADLHARQQRLIAITSWSRQLDAISASLAGRSGLESLQIADSALMKEPLRRLDEVQEFIQRAIGVETSIKTTLKTLAVAEEEEQGLLNELEALGVCPACSQPIGAAHRLHLEAAS
jgi:hypothetical protein